MDRKRKSITTDKSEEVPNVVDSEVHCNSLLPSSTSSCSTWKTTSLKEPVQSINLKPYEDKNTPCANNDSANLNSITPQSQLYPSSPMSTGIHKLHGLSLQSPGSSFTPIPRRVSQTSPSSPMTKNEARSSSIQISHKKTAVAILQPSHDFLSRNSISLPPSQKFLSIAPLEELSLPKVTLTPRSKHTVRSSEAILSPFDSNYSSIRARYGKNKTSPRPPIEFLNFSSSGFATKSNKAYQSLLDTNQNEIVDDYGYVFDDISVESLSDDGNDEFFLCVPDAANSDFEMNKKARQFPMPSFGNLNSTRNCAKNDSSMDPSHLLSHQSSNSLLGIEFIEES
ncbi:predicted protein [Chaetoceros tenuissimus]|uniref:Uncharacterized protein n=1 Tax=Chaetoceros tenuissimus TaxID=426638 RepID=A0AAD3D418_9STRA|nr:predicted protein [Chaetoceros tenuissimus]